MAGWLIQNRVKTLKALQQFDGLDYAFDPDRSTPSNPVYVRYH